MLTKKNLYPTKYLIEQGVTTWQAAIRFVHAIPYGRTSNRSDLNLVITENKGTCSSKHALLKTIADQNKIPNIKLVLAIYKMNQQNTPGIGNLLDDTELSYIPEAHCYLNIDGDKKDLTFAASDISKLEKYILLEKEITPDQVTTYKVEFHKDYIKEWMRSEKLNMTFDQLWTLREQCIANLSNS